MTDCKFYKADLDARREAEEMEAAYRTSIGEERWAAEQEETAAFIAAMGEPEEDSPLCKCGEFCKHLGQGKGFPGEYVYHCKAPGNEHIIHVDFNEAEII